MGLLDRQAIGMEISHGGIAAVSVMQRAETALLLRATRLPLPQECLSTDLKSPQVLLPAEFVRVAREAWGSLHLSSRQVALSLPDSAGHLIITTLAEPWKHRAEVLELLRWQLGKRLGISPEQLHLDVQLLEHHADGRSDLLVALTQRELILQYEDLLQEAGLQPTRIGFHTPHLTNLFERFKAGTGQIVTWYDNALGVTAQTATRLVFCRVKQLSVGADQPARLRHELTASLAASRQACSETASAASYLMAPPDENTLEPLLSAATGSSPHRLRPEVLIQQNPDLNLSAVQLFQVSAAVGAVLGGR